MTSFYNHLYFYTFGSLSCGDMKRKVTTILQMASKALLTTALGLTLGIWTKAETNLRPQCDANNSLQSICHVYKLCDTFS